MFPHWKQQQRENFEEVSLLSETLVLVFAVVRMTIVTETTFALIMIIVMTTVILNFVRAIEPVQTVLLIVHRQHQHPTPRRPLSQMG